MNSTKKFWILDCHSWVLKLSRINDYRSMKEEGTIGYLYPEYYGLNVSTEVMSMALVWNCWSLELKTFENKESYVQG